MDQNALLAALLLTSLRPAGRALLGGPDLPDLAELAGALEGALRKVLVGPMAEAIRRSKLPPYLRRSEVLELTGWSGRKLSYLQAKRRIPFVKRGRTVLFKTSDVEAFLMEGYVPATPKPATSPSRR